MPPPPVRRSKPRLGDVLVSMGFLTADQAEGVSVHQRQWGMSFGRAAIARGLCTDEQVASALAKQLGMNSIDLEREQQHPEVRGLLSLAGAQQHRAVLLRIDGATLKVAMAAPATFPAQDAIRALVGKSRLDVALASDIAIERAICRFYGLPMTETTNDAQSARDPALTASPHDAVLPRDFHDAVTGMQPMLTPQVAVIPRPAPVAPPRPQGQSAGAMGRVEIFDLLGLSPRAADLVKRMGQSNKLNSREVIARIVEQWAAARKD